MKKTMLALVLCSIVFANEGGEIARTRASYRTDYSSKSEEHHYSSELLFILHAKDAHISMDTKGGYFLTLYGTEKNVTYFSERPRRKAGKISTKQFLDNWDQSVNSLRNDYSNAGIVTFSQSKSSQKFTDYPLALSNPQFEEDSERLTFDVKKLEKGQTFPTGDLGEVTLFFETDQKIINSQIID